MTTLQLTYRKTYTDEWVAFGPISPAPDRNPGSGRAVMSPAAQQLSDESRIGLMDLPRQELGSFDASTELDPMKAADLKHEIDWTKTLEEGRYAGIAQYLTSGWSLEPKLDGCRMRLFLGMKGNTLNTGRRSVKTYKYQNRTDNFPHLRDAAIEGLAGTILDGELISSTSEMMTGDGTMTRSLLNASVALCNSSPEKSVAAQNCYGKANFWAFDVMAFQGESVAHLSYTDRRELLAKIVAAMNELHPDCKIFLVPSYQATAENCERTLEEGFEGAMLKKNSGTYQFGKRSKVWLKVKGFSTGDFVITGFEPGNNGFAGLVGSICFSVRQADGNWFEAGKFGNLELTQRHAMTDEYGQLKEEWYGQVVEIMAQARTKTNRLRHAHLIRFRPDKEAGECTWDQLELFGTA